MHRKSFDTASRRSHRSVRRRQLRVEALEPRVVLNAAPVAKNDRFEVVQDGVASIDYLLLNDHDSDGDTLAVISQTIPSHGALVKVRDNVFTYTPSRGYTGPDSFYYTVSDGNGGTAQAKVSIMVNAPIDAIQARSEILNGVSVLADPNGPGYMVVYGPTAINVANYPGKDNSDPMIAAATLGKGRIIAVPDAQWLDLDRPGFDESTATFHINGLAWLARSTEKNVRIVTFEDSGSMNWLRDRGFTNVRDARTATLASDLVGAKVFMAGWMGPELSEATRNTIRNFVVGGGGLFIAEYGIGYDWWWNKDTLDIPGNQLLKDAGIGFRKEWPHSGEQAVTAADRTTTVDQIEAIFRDPSSVPQSQVIEALNIYSAISGVLASDDSVRARLDLAFAAMTATVNPTPASPVSDDLSKAILNAEMAVLSTQAPEKVKAHRTAEAVYGDIPDNAPRIANRVVTIDGDKTGWVATGMYAAPGDLVTIEVPSSLVNKGYSFRINGHTGNVARHSSWDRVPFGVSRTFPIVSGTTRIANAFGGQIYLDFGGAATGTSPGLGNVSLTIKNAIEAPYFVLGVDTDANWVASLRDRPAPYAELVSERLAISVPSAWIRDLSSPTDLMKFWDETGALMDYIAGTSDLRTGPDRINVDAQISVGLLHAGYPIQGPTWYGSRIVDLPALQSEGDWGWFHELGHERQVNRRFGWGYENPWTFPDGVEVTVNIFANAALEKMTTVDPLADYWNYSVSPAMVMRGAIAEVTSTVNQTFDSRSLYPYYFQLADGPWGWQGYHDVMATYVDDQLNAPTKIPKTAQEKKDQWLIRWSRASGFDMRSYMVDHWGLNVTSSARDAVAAMRLPSWMPLATKFESLKVASGTSRRLDLKNGGMALDGVARLISVSQPTRGTLVLGDDDVYIYTPAIGPLLADEFEVVYESSAGNRQTFKIPVEVVGPQGLLMERFDGIPGESVASLTASESYPDSPTRTDYLLDFKSPLNSGDNYGIRVRGYVSVPTSGEYRFYIASDDGSELRLSTTEFPEDAVKIAELQGWTNPENYNTRSSQTSRPISLQAGRYYYIEALMKEGGGGDHLSVAWTGPGMPSPITITNDYLLPYGNQLDRIVPVVPTVSLSINVATIAEAQGEAAVTANLSQVSTKPVTVLLSVSGTASPIVDHNLGQSVSIVIPAGELTGALNVIAVSDELDEPDETISFEVSSITNGTAGTNQKVSVTIIDDDEPPSDFGDAPAPYPVTLEQNGARHQVGALYLGSRVDAELNGRASVGAGGDSDDDGVVFISTLLSANEGTTSSLLVYASAPGKLDGWIDFNRDGDWLDAGEQIFVSRDVAEGENVLSFSVAANAVPGDTVARFRLSSTGRLAPTGPANDGEVEDHSVRIVRGGIDTVANLSVSSGSTALLNEGADVIAWRNDQVLFRAPLSMFSSLQVAGTSADHLFQVGSQELLHSKRLQVNGGSGTNSIQVVGAGHTLDLTSDRIVLHNIASIDISGAGDNRLVVGVDSVKGMSVGALRIIHNAGDSITFAGRWKVEAPRFVDGRLYHVVSEDASDVLARVEIRNDRPFTNPSVAHDVDRDGKVLPVDALRIINELSRRGFGPIAIPEAQEQVGRFYYDVSGDMQLTALDALRVINALSRMNRLGVGEGENGFQAVPVPLPSIGLVSETRASSSDAEIMRIGVSRNLGDAKKLGMIHTDFQRSIINSSLDDSNVDQAMLDDEVSWTDDSFEFGLSLMSQGATEDWIVA